jgi:hypothetical protein
VNWGSAAYEPTRHQQQDNRVYGEFGNQKGAPYGLYRTFLTGKQVWDVPLGTLFPVSKPGPSTLGTD